MHAGFVTQAALDWHAALGGLDAARFTEAGRAAGRRAATELEAFLGPGWLYRAAHRPALALADYSPSLGGRAAYVNAVALWARLRLLVEHGVQGIAKLRGNLARNPSLDEFRHGTTQARLACQALLAGARPVLEPPIGDVCVHDGAAELLLELRGLNPAERTGPPVRRLVRAVELKAKQTRAAPAVWVWISDAGAAWSLPGFADRPAGDRIAFLAAALDRVFDTWPHLLGVVLSSAPLPPAPDGFLSPATPGDQGYRATPGIACADRGAAFVRRLPSGALRETVVAHRPGLASEHFAPVHRLCADEPAWLDAALARLGVPGGVEALVR